MGVEYEILVFKRISVFSSWVKFLGRLWKFSMFNYVFLVNILVD